MFAYVQDKKVVGIYTTDTIKLLGTAAVIVPLSGRKDIPHLGWSYDGKVFTEPVTAKIDTSLEEIQAAALVTIDTETSSLRKHYLGDLESQFGIYTAKYQDARAYKLKVFGEDAASYSWLSAEASATGCTLAEAAERFIEKYSTMVAALAKAEEFRVYGKAAIREAKNAKDVRDIKMEMVSEIRKLK